MKQSQLGFIGLGAMGDGMARNLLAAGYPLMAYDIDGARMAALMEARAQPAAGAEVIMSEAEVVLTSLPSAETWNNVAAEALVPGARKGQVIIDVGTNAPANARDYAARFAAKGAFLLDAPVSGGPKGSADGSLRIFASGRRPVFDRCLPILRVIGDADRIIYCGRSGQGHVAKGVNQLAMGLVNAAVLEALSLGINSGLDPEVLDRGIGGDTDWRAAFSRVAQRVAQGDGHRVGIKYGQFPYYLREAAERGCELPITAALHDYLLDAEPIMTEANRPSPSLWFELVEKED
jgi:3-hydroxyisobutyrate dehydrogenase-like beta-hydroxyacid dehydrogenase